MLAHAVEQRPLVPTFVATSSARDGAGPQSRSGQPVILVFWGVVGGFGAFASYKIEVVKDQCHASQ